ncbi:MAG: hypothetical protein PHF56_06860 [Desulfuromonadaceae bacterium]|nr:hypothetical protein [Desulfuromonadaceae bacterium]
MAPEDYHNSYTMSTSKGCATMYRAFQITVFIGIMALHLIYSVILRGSACGPQPTVLSYITNGDVFLGFSLAVGALFTCCCLRRFSYTRSRGAVAGAVGGTAAITGVAAAGCFLTGCCGSPMLIVYAGILGFQGVEIPKWGIAVVTTVLTGFSWWWLTRTGKCSCTNKSC